MSSVRVAQVMRQVCEMDFEEARKGLELLGLSPPLVLKPVQSSGTDGVKLCRSWHEAHEHLQALRGTKSSVSAPLPKAFEGLSMALASL